MNDEEKRREIWSGFHEAAEVRMTVICVVLFLSTVVLGILTYYIGVSVVTVEFHVKFDIAIGLTLITVGLGLTWIFVTWYLCRVTRIWLDIARKEVETPIEHPFEE